MLELLSNINLYTHIIAGGVTLLAGPFAIYFNMREVRKHRVVGKIFYYAMLVVAISAIIAFFKRPDQVFFQFLLGIALLVLAGIFRGIRSVFLMKGGKVLPFDWAYTGLLAMNGVFMLTMSAYHFYKGSMIAFPILFGVFGLSCVVDTYQSWRAFSRPEAMHSLSWLRMHFLTMIGAFIASTTAFTVNAAHFLPWWAQWFGPTILLVPLQFYFGRKVRKMHEKALKKA